MDNKDLVWNLEGFSQRSVAADFVMQFENKLCVFSNTVEQLYTNYTIHFPKDENHNLVILPNPYAHHDTFQNVSEEAIVNTGLNIVPGSVVGKSGLYITIPFKGGKGMKPVPLQVGLKAINSRRSPDNPFLPVLMKGDLRELQQDTPCLHLHALTLSKLKDISSMERTDIHNVVQQHLSKL